MRRRECCRGAGRDPAHVPAARHVVPAGYGVCPADDDGSPHVLPGHPHAVPAARDGLRPDPADDLHAAAVLSAAHAPAARHLVPAGDCVRPADVPHRLPDARLSAPGRGPARGGVPPRWPGTRPEVPPRPPIGPKTMAGIHTRCPVIHTECPPLPPICPQTMAGVHTRCPVIHTQCPPLPPICVGPADAAGLSAAAVIQPNTVQPAQTACPPINGCTPKTLEGVPTQCPSIPTQCPVNPTLCGGIFPPTICQVPTHCPPHKTVCPPNQPTR